MDTLSLDQTVALFNLFGFWLITSALLSITLNIAGNIIVEKCNLEVKYPKLSKFLRARTKLSRAYLWFHFFILIITIIIYIAYNVNIVFF